MRVRSAMLVSVVFVLLLAGCPNPGGQGGPGGGGGMGSAPPVMVFVEPPVMMEYAPAIELVGEIRASQRAVLSAEVAGRVVSIAHRVGESHPRGAGALVQLNQADYLVALAAAEAQLNQAKEGLQAAKKGPRSQVIAAQEASVDAARAQHENALDYLRRQQELYRKGVIPESALVTASAQEQSAKAALDAQLEVLDQMLEGTRAEDLAQAQAMVDLASAGVEQAQLALNKTAVKPAFDAVVTELYVEVGTFVGPGTPVAEVVADAPAEAWFNIPEENINEVKVGGMVEVTVDSLPGETIEGTVLSVSIAGDDLTHQFPCRVAITDQRVLPGMVANARIHTAEPVPTLMIKRDATVLTNLGMVVYKMGMPTGEVFAEYGDLPKIPAEMVPVTLGPALGDLVSVEGDIDMTSLIITRGNEQCYPGAFIVPTNLGGPGGGMPPDGAPGEGMPPEAAEGMPAEAPPEGGEMPAGDETAVENGDQHSEDA